MKEEVDGIKSLVVKAQNGDLNAFEHIVKKYNKKIYNLALRILQNNDDALDVMQDTFIAVFEKIKDFNFNSQFYTWLYRIATNFALMKIRKNKNSPIRESEFEKKFDSPLYDHVHSYELSAEKILLDKELNFNLDKAIKNLPEIYKAVFILRDIEDLSIKETSSILDISESNVKIRLKRARIFLREQLEQFFSERGAVYELQK